MGSSKGGIKVKLGNVTNDELLEKWPFKVDLEKGTVTLLFGRKLDTGRYEEEGLDLDTMIKIKKYEIICDHCGREVERWKACECGETMTKSKELSITEQRIYLLLKAIEKKKEVVKEERKELSSLKGLLDKEQGRLVEIRQKVIEPLFID